MAVYEAVVIFDPALNDEQVAQQVEDVRRRLTAPETGCQLVSEAAWGKRQLAFPIKKKRDGIYNVFRLFHEDDTGHVTFVDVERFLRFSEYVLRHVIIRMPDAIKDEPILTPPVYSRPTPSGPRSRGVAHEAPAAAAPADAAEPVAEAAPAAEVPAAESAGAAAPTAAE